jgi:hypothetical protein
VELEVGLRRQHVRDPVLVDPQAIDLLEQSRRVGIEGLAAVLRRGLGERAIAFPRLAVGLAGHVRQWVQPVFGAQRDLVHGDVVRPAALAMKRPRRIEVAVGRRVQLGRVALQGVGAELLDVDGDRRGQPLRPERVEAHRAAVRIRAEGQTVPGAGLVAGDQRLGVLDGGGGAREDGDRRLAHATSGSSLRRG